MLALLLLVVVGAATTFGVRLLVRSNALLEHSYQVLNHLEASRAALGAAQAAARGYRLTSHEALYSEFEGAAPRALGAAEALVGATADNPRQQDRARQLLAEATGQITRMIRLVEIQRQDGAAAAIQSMRPEELVARLQRFNAISTDIRADELRLLAHRRAANARNLSLLLAFVLLGLGVSLATLWALLVSLHRENFRNSRLEREARVALAHLQRSQATTERLSEQRRALSEYTGLLQSAQNLDEAMTLTSATLEQLLPHLGGHCYLARASRDLLESRATFGRETIPSSDLFETDACWALRRGQPHHNRGGGTVRCGHLEHGRSLAGISTLCVPLAAQGETLGMLHANAPTDGSATDNDATIIELLAEQLAMAIANLKLRETLRQQSLRDPLTGLFNRRYFEESLRREMQRCERRQLPLALLVLDVDNFKAFNDTHGHTAGDAVLAHVGSNLASLVRAEDLACRYGGEEFTVVMPEVGTASARERAEAIRGAVSGTTIVHNGRALGPVTLSIGIAIHPGDGVTPELLFEVADASLYQAKAEGRNRVVHATAEA